MDRAATTAAAMNGDPVQRNRPCGVFNDPAFRDDLSLPPTGARLVYSLSTASPFVIMSTFAHRY